MNDTIGGFEELPGNSRRSRSLANIQILGLSRRTGPLKEAYDKIEKEDTHDRELDFKYSEQALREAEEQ